MCFLASTVTELIKSTSHRSTHGGRHFTVCRMFETMNDSKFRRKQGQLQNLASITQYQEAAIVVKENETCRLL